jgi:phosphoserine phosphatase
VLIARVIADRAALSASLAQVLDALAQQGLAARHFAAPGGADEIICEAATAADWPQFRTALERHLPPADVLIADHLPLLPGLFVSDMDSTMIGQECIDELADFAGLKPQIAAITERAMQGELDFAAALRERVTLLAGLDEAAIARCLAERITPMPGAKTLVATLKSLGCHTVLVTGGFHPFADPVAARLGFERVVANRLEIADGKLTGRVTGAIIDSSVKRSVLEEEAARLSIGRASGRSSLATGDGANDISMLEAACYGIAYHAKPKARAAAHGWIDEGDLTDVLRLLGIREAEWMKC